MYLLKFFLLPIDKIGNVISVTMADPLNEGVIQMLKTITNCDIVVFISTYSEIKEAINICFSDKLKELEASVIDTRDIEKIKTAGASL